MIWLFFSGICMSVWLSLNFFVPLIQGEEISSLVSVMGCMGVFIVLFDVIAFSIALAKGLRESKMKENQGEKQ